MRRPLRITKKQGRACLDNMAYCVDADSSILVYGDAYNAVMQLREYSDPWLGTPIRKRAVINHALIALAFCATLAECEYGKRD